MSKKHKILASLCQTGPMNFEELHAEIGGERRLLSFSIQDIRKNGLIDSFMEDGGVAYKINKEGKAWLDRNSATKEADEPEQKAEAVAEPAEQDAAPATEPAKQLDDGFIAWAGGDCPVSKNVRVVVKLRSYGLSDIEEAGFFDWHHSKPASGDDIIAYKIVELPTGPAPLTHDKDDPPENWQPQEIKPDERDKQIEALTNQVTAHQEESAQFKRELTQLLGMASTPRTLGAALIEIADAINKAKPKAPAMSNGGRIQGRVSDQLAAHVLMLSCHAASAERGEKPDVIRSLCRLHGDITYATEGHIGNLLDYALHDRPMLEAGLADAVIRIFDLAGGLELDLAGAIAEKLDLCASREIAQQLQQGN